VSVNLTTFSQPSPLKTAVLFLVFNRLDTTRQVFEAIRLAKPPRLYIASDGARLSREGEDETVKAVREYLVSNIDWECEVKILFREQNLGCKLAVSSAISWFFENEEMGIILEDDCLPDPSFFPFCEELLERYRHDPRIGMISGDNFQFGHKINNDSYYFSNINHIWGWATWRSRWQHDYDVAIKHWPQIRDEGRVADWFGSKAEQDSFAENFEKVYQGKIDTWDYQWHFGSRLNGRISVMPNFNLISNIGFGEGATHTIGESKLANLVIHEMQFPLKHPAAVFASQIMDSRWLSNFLTISIYSRLRKKITNFFRRRQCLS
jgi:hypothetical protein